MSKKRTTEEVEEVFEDAALLGLAALKAFLTYQGDNPIYLAKAKAGAVGVTGYTRLVAANTNRQMVKLATERGEIGVGGGKTRKALASGDK